LNDEKLPDPADGLVDEDIIKLQLGMTDGGGFWVVFCGESVPLIGLSHQGQGWGSPFHLLSPY
jgi:hypothetical protein